MPLFWSKGVGGRRFGANITADRHGVRKPVWLKAPLQRILRLVTRNDTMNFFGRRHRD
ncbi:uncharacterized protein EAF02_000095 [Botrytis sinoallii]|uniref:uncharacterized protein n=1 Tax=Botrytis sinoallii TaxID=1463999 RepID=UPI0018FF6203|nr:uncharacterized protein EAF02_000095 [Botrytis sinoallii]KAF7892557.1 hypothetical protein EAF02_000095 [Botrytis sinoallii]